MAFDIAVSENTDLILSGSRDLAGISGDGLTEQRIKTRLKIVRGSWVLDDEGDLGSLISAHLGAPITRFVRQLPDVIRSALLDMDEIQISDVQITQYGATGVVATISYSYLPDTDLPGVTLDEFTEQQVSVFVDTGVGEGE